MASIGQNPVYILSNRREQKVGGLFVAYRDTCNLLYSILGFDWPALGLFYFKKRMYTFARIVK